MERICKNCRHLNCENKRKRCVDCIVSDKGCKQCNCITVNFNANMCEFFTPKKEYNDDKSTNKT